MPEGMVVAVYVSPKAREPLHAVSSAVAVAGRGLEGDRYCSGRGALSRWWSPARAVSFIEREAIDALRREFDLGEGRSRRNVVTEGIRLDELQGRTFRIGTALFKGVQACQPCRYLERLTQPGVLEALKGRGGLRAEVVEGGSFAPGDAIEVVAGFPPSPLYSGKRGRG
jgi:MOSC domain-containing protein YiiM